MDAFVTRKSREPRTRRPPSPERRTVQLRIDDLRRVAKLTTIRQLCERLRTEADKLPALRELGKQYVHIDVLEETGIGRVVYRLRRAQDAEIARLAEELYVRWRTDAKDAAESRHRRQAGAAAAAAANGEDGERDPSRDFMVAAEVDLEAEMADWDRAATGAATRPAPQQAPPQARGSGVGRVAAGHGAPATGGDSLTDASRSSAASAAAVALRGRAAGGVEATSSSNSRRSTDAANPMPPPPPLAQAQSLRPGMLVVQRAPAAANASTAGSDGGRTGP
jgi:hypothetical protein